jgi:G3E family GTPase
LLPSASQPTFSVLPGSRAVLGHGSTIASWSSFVDTQPTWAGIAAWWNLLTQRFGQHLLRCKGLLQVNDPSAFVLIQGVGKVFHTPTTLAAWPDADPRGRLVCIGTDLDPVWLQASLKALLITEPSSKPRNLDELNECF